ncbi:MAG: efflux RND transporter periplasmic adaptor subunit [Betaproteobacteria bacterium]|nr:efflux RND transporter periplasmic adaptor subunit [Betaproteobacteria bacterium]
MKRIHASIIFSAALFPAMVAAQGLATAIVDFREVGSIHVADGVVEAVRASAVAAQVSGRVIELRANAGDTVAKGQVLARIDEREAAQGVAAGQAQVARAESDLGNARANLERTQKLVAQNFVSKAAVDKAQADFDAARAQLAAARASTTQAVTVQGHSTITAPFSGVIAERLTELGDMALPGKPLFSVFDPKDLRAVANVPQAKIADIRAGASASVEITALAQRIPATRIVILPSADPRTHTTQVRLELPETLKGAYPGQFARVYFSVGRAKKLVIPSSAVVHRSEVDGAYVVDARGGVSFRQVRLGEAAGESAIELLAGINPGEQVALDPVAALAALKQTRPRP